MLTQMRKPVAKILTLALFSMLILSFAVWGIGDIFRGGGRVSTVVKVGDTEVDQSNFSRSLTRELNRLQTSFGTRIDIEQARAFGVVDQVLQQLVTRALFDEQAKRLGMVVSEQQIKDRIIAEPAFHDQFGEFDRNRFVQVLRGTGLSEGQFVDTLKQDIRRQQIADATTSGLAAPATLAKAAYRYAEERRIGETLAVPLSAMEDPGDPTEEQIASFYEANKDDFMRPETRSVTLVQLRAEDLADEIAVTEEDLAASFEERREDFATPEQRTLEQIVLPDEEAAERAHAMLNDGADFAAVAESETGGGPLDLGSFSQEELAGEFPDLAQAAFSLDAGAISQPVRSSFGWHLIHVTEIEPAEEPSFEELRDELAQDLAMRQAVDSMISIANQLDDELAGGATVEEAAGVLDLKVTEIAAVDARGNDAGGQAIEDLPPLDDFLPVLRETETGEESLLTETTDGNYFILRVDGVTPAEPRPLEEVRDDVIAQWKDGERDRLARERAETLSGRAKEGIELSALADDPGISYSVSDSLTRAGQAASGQRNQALAGQLFDLAPGEIATFKAGDSHYVVKLKEIQSAEPSADAEALATQRETLSGNLQNDLITQFSAALRDEFGVSVNQRLIEDVLASY